MNHKQKNWPEWLASVEFAINNKAHLTTKVSPFMENYGRELRMGINIRRKRKMEKATEFAEKMKKVQKEVRAALKRAQKEMSDKLIGKGKRQKYKRWKIR